MIFSLCAEDIFRLDLRGGQTPPSWVNQTRLPADLNTVPTAADMSYNGKLYVLEANAEGDLFEYDVEAKTFAHVTNAVACPPDR